CQLRRCIMSDTHHTNPLQYTIISSPIGDLLIAAVGAQVIRVAFQAQGFPQVLDALGNQFGPAAQHDDETLIHAAQQFDEYFAGRRQVFKLPLYQYSTQSFGRVVQQHLTTIPYGQTRSYSQLAEQLGKPGAARAVGSACANNPLPLIQPCHRVVRADGSYGQYSGSPETKSYLLPLERGETPIATTSAVCQRLDRFLWRCPSWMGDKASTFATVFRYCVEPPRL